MVSNNSNSKLLLFIAVLLFATSSAAVARNELTINGFGQDRFFLADNSQPKGFAMVKDPIDLTNKENVYRFKVRPARCIGSDCQQQSARSSLQQRHNVKQPKEAWYGWEIYFPKEFPIGDSLVSGIEIFNEWKDQDQCVLVSLAIFRGERRLSWHMEEPTGGKATQNGGDCRLVFDQTIGFMSDLTGSWHRFELSARWSGGADGRFMLYLDGKLNSEYSGRTCNENCAKNYHLFGNYLCCTPDTKSIAETTVYYRHISRAEAREGLNWEN